LNSKKKSLVEALENRKNGDSLRILSAERSGETGTGLVDFCSNDYLGFSRSEILRDKIRQAEKEYPDINVGSTGSRLISGNTRFCEELESRIARFHQAEAGLIFNSGYDANLGLFSSLPQRTDTIIYDQLVHASIRDGIRLGLARAFPFKHNDVEDLERKFKAATGNIFVAVESIYSMDGDCAPLVEMAELCNQYDSDLIVDEAHATGVFGEKGRGTVVELGLEGKVFARLHTFGKALGCHGAIVVGSETLRSYLINFARSFIYTTALPFHSLMTISCAYDLLESSDKEQTKLKKNISYYKEERCRQSESGGQHKTMESNSAIQCIIIPGNENVKTAARSLQQAGFDVRPILHPTVPTGSERLRICLHAFNTDDEISRLITALKGVIQ
jgi:8-amino-7-oxononanoate synthase